MKKNYTLLLFFLSIHPFVLFGQDSINKSLNQAKNYIQQEFKAKVISYDGLMLLPFLQKSFGFEIISQKQVEGFLLEKKSEHPLDALCLKIAIPNYKIGTSDLEGVNAEEQLFAKVVNIESFSNEKESLIIQLKEMSKLGTYFTTHAALGLHILNLKGFAKSDELDRFKLDMVQIAENESYNPDLRIESIAFMTLFGWKDVLKQKHLDYLLKTQQPNGAWAGRLNSEKSSSHTTILALLAILNFYQLKPFNL